MSNNVVTPAPWPAAKSSTSSKYAFTPSQVIQWLRPTVGEQDIHTYIQTSNLANKNTIWSQSLWLLASGNKEAIWHTPTYQTMAQTGSAKRGAIVSRIQVSNFGLMFCVCQQCSEYHRTTALEVLTPPLIYVPSFVPVWVPWLPRSRDQWILTCCTITSAHTAWNTSCHHVG